MRSLHKRLKSLEDASRRSSRSVSVEALEVLSDEDLDVLEETLETALASVEGSFEDFYAVVKERGRRALHAHIEAIEAWRRGEWQAVPVDEVEVSRRLEELAQGTKAPGYRNGYRVWSYRKERTKGHNLHG
jgi:hypothetical protein